MSELFTPGPWQRLSARLEIIGAENVRTAFVEGRTIPEREANARLITAAPAMRELLARAVTALEDCDAGECQEAREARELLAQIDGKAGG